MTARRSTIPIPHARARLYEVLARSVRHRGDVNAIHAEIETTATALLTEISHHMQRKTEAL